jgi:hypothetical protein
MFDQESSLLLQSAPSISGTDASDLPRLLTEIYTQLVTERLRGGIDNEALSSIERLSEIANSYESIAVTSGDTVIVRASAFVAGSAYQILAKTLPSIDQDQVDDNILNRDHIGGDLSAALLFLIAQQLPDAREAIRRFAGVTQAEPFVIQQLSASLIDLVKENFGSIINRATERRQSPNAMKQDNELVDRASIHLYQLLLEGIELLASIILGQNPADYTDQVYETPTTVFQQVLSLSTREYNIRGLQGNYLSTYPGPAHLATLLANLGQTLLDASILLLPAPDGSNANVWWSWLNFRASQKPLLWPNHRIAIEKGFHLPGNSAILVLPTGAGKTTISEFKIAATLATGKQVVFLAPTNALVDQLRRDLESSLPQQIFGMDSNYDADLFTAIKGTLPDLSVMTPEKCLAVLNFNPEAFERVGLVIFDECHSLSSEAGSLRRALDGMLVILRLAALLPEVDFLFLSAMIQKPELFAEWISELTNKNCIPIDLVWKPSRQARGVVIYPSQEIKNTEAAATKLQLQLDQQAISGGGIPSQGLRSAPKRLLKAVPYALFGLVNNWHPDRPQDIRIRRLAVESISLNHELSLSRKVHAKPNGNGVSRQLAIASAKAELKTIVFMNNTSWVNKSARETGRAFNFSIGYNRDEERLFSAIETEFGNPACSIMHNMLYCVPHHADLIPHERQLAESLFRREDGARIIYATTTLSQGMNLPAQVAILSADERAELGEYVTQQPMKAHELLNAAGRAGRAGYLANGLVILVPRTLLTFTDKGPEESAHTVLQSIIPEDERCVPIIDPLGTVLDRVQQGLPPNADTEYLFHRLGDSKNADAIEGLFKKSLAYFIANKQNDRQAFEAGIAAVVKQIAESDTETDISDWLIQMSIQSGMAPQILVRLYRSLNESFEQLPDTVHEWVDWMLAWLSHDVDAGRFCFGIDFGPLQTIGGVPQINGDNYDATLKTLANGMTSLLRGDTLSEVERAMGGTLAGQKIFCPKARELVTNIAPRRLSYSSTFIVQIVKKIAEEKETFVDALAVLECLPGAIAQGASSPEQLAFMHLTKNRYRSRVEAHRDYNSRFKKLALPNDVPYANLIQLMIDLIE